MKKNYYIQGDPTRADKIKAAFEKLGINVLDFGFADKTVVYCSIGGCVQYLPYSINLMNILYSHPDYQELELSVKPKPKVGDWVVFNNNHNSVYQIGEIRDSYYKLTHTHGGSMPLPFSQGNFLRPWSIEDAKDGDVLAADECYVIFKEIDGLNIKCYCTYHYMGFNPSFHIDTLQNKTAFNPATKEQRDLLFKKMKEAGYEWDGDKKELRKIKPHYDNQELELPTKPNPKFKVGDDIKTGNTIETIAEVGHATRSYYCESGRTIYFENQDLWHLVPKPHYDISNFKPFDKVLVRDADDTKWRCNWFSHYSGDGGVYRFVTTKCGYAQCIPFEGNEHLLGTTNMCDKRFINW